MYNIKNACLLLSSFLLHLTIIASVPFTPKKTLKQLRFETRRADQKQRNARKAEKQKLSALKKTAHSTIIALQQLKDHCELPTFGSPSGESTTMQTSMPIHAGAAGLALGSGGMTAAMNINQQTALVVHGQHNSQIARRFAHLKPSERLAILDKARGFRPKYNNTYAARAQDFYDPELVKEEPLLMLAAPTSSDTALVKTCEALGETVQVSNAGITNLLIAKLESNDQLMLDSTDLDVDPLHPALLILANTSHNNYALTRALIQRGAHVNKKSYFSEQPLHFACKKGRYQIVLALLEEPHAGINDYTYSPELRLKTIVSKNERAQMRSDFNAFGIESNGLNMQKFMSVRVQDTPLILAVKNQHRLCVILMILSGAQLQLHGSQQYENHQNELTTDWWTPLEYAENALDAQLLKVPGGDVPKARGIIDLLQNSETIEKRLNETEIKFLKNYFLERYPALACIQLPENVQWIVCRYLGFARWDEQSLIRAKKQNPHQPLMTEEQLNRLLSIVGQPTKANSASLDTVKSDNLPSFTQSDKADVDCFALHTVLEKITAYSLVQNPKLESQRAAYVQAAAYAISTLYPPKAISQPGSPFKVFESDMQKKELTLREKQQREFDDTIANLLDPARKLVESINKECQAYENKVRDEFIKNLLTQRSQSSQSNDMSTDFSKITKALEILKNATKKDLKSEKEIADYVYTAACAYEILPQALQQTPLIANQRQVFAQMLEKAFILALNLLELLKAERDAQQNAKDAEHCELIAVAAIPVKK